MSRSRRSRRTRSATLGALYELAASDLGTTADELAFDRSPQDYRCSRLVEFRFVPDWASTQAALDAIAPAAIILDIRLNGQDSWEFLTRLKRDD